MKTKKLMSLAAAAVCIGVVTTASCAAASTGAKAFTGTGAKASAEAKAAVKGGRTHVTVWSVNSDGPYFQEIVTGAVGDYGHGVTVLPDGKVDPEHTSELQLNMRYGSFRLSIATIDKDVSKAYQHWAENPATCSGSIGFTATAPVVAGTGTGRYRGITGTFRMKVTIDEVDVTQVCNGTSKFLSQIILMDGSGTVSY